MTKTKNPSDAKPKSGKVITCGHKGSVRLLCPNSPAVEVSRSAVRPDAKPKSGWEGGNAQILAAFNMLSSGVGLKETMSRCLSLSAFVFDKFEKTAPKTPRRIEVIVNSTVRITIEDVSDFKEVG